MARSEFMTKSEQIEHGVKLLESGFFQKMTQPLIAPDGEIEGWVDFGICQVNWEDCETAGVFIQRNEEGAITHGLIRLFTHAEGKKWFEGMIQHALAQPPFLAQPPPARRSGRTVERPPDTQ